MVCVCVCVFVHACVCVCLCVCVCVWRGVPFKIKGIFLNTTDYIINVIFCVTVARTEAYQLKPFSLTLFKVQVSEKEMMTVY